MGQDILDIIKRLDVRQNVTIRVIDEPTGKVVQEHVGHNAATNSLLTGIAHYLMGDGVLNQGSDTLSMWVPQYISVGTMGLTSQESETILDNDVSYVVPSALGYTPVAPEEATTEEKNLNTVLRFTEYINQTPGFGADGYDSAANNDREWFGLGYPYTIRPDALKQNFYTWDGAATSFTLSETPTSIVSVTLYPGGVVNQNTSDTTVVRKVLTSSMYSVSGKTLSLLYYPETIPANSRLAVIYTCSSTDAANCELIEAKYVDGKIVPLSLRSKITYRDVVPEIQSELPGTLDVVYSAFVSTGALKEYRGDNDYIYITEAGLWSKPSYNDSGDNGLLAGYRITPTDDDFTELGLEQIFYGTGSATAFTFDQTALEITSVTINNIPTTDYTLDTSHNQIVFFEAPANEALIIVMYKTTSSWKDMSREDNRHAVQRSIIRVGVNQVAQIIWKLQLGGLEQLGGLRSLYPSQHIEEVWYIV